MYSKIINPITGRKVSIYTNLGKNIIKNYINVSNYKIGGSNIKSKNHDLYEGCEANERVKILKKGNIGDTVEYHTDNQLGYAVFEIIEGDEVDGKTLKQIGDIYGMFSNPEHPEYIGSDDESY